MKKRVKSGIWKMICVLVVCAVIAIPLVTCEKCKVCTLKDSSGKVVETKTYCNDDDIKDAEDLGMTCI